MAAEDDVMTSVRAAFASLAPVSEVRMFGGTGFMLDGNMVAALSKRGLLLRVGKDREAGALARAGTRAMEMRGRKMDGYVYVDPPPATVEAVGDWLRLALEYVRTLPAKQPNPNAKKEKRR